MDGDKTIQKAMVAMTNNRVIRSTDSFLIEAVVNHTLPIPVLRAAALSVVGLIL